MNNEDFEEFLTKHIELNDNEDQYINSSFKTKNMSFNIHGIDFNSNSTIKDILIKAMQNLNSFQRDDAIRSLKDKNSKINFLINLQI